MPQKIDRTGEINHNKQGMKMWIKEYRNANDIDIEFEDGFISYNKAYKDFKIKNIRNLNLQNPNVIDRTGDIIYNKYGEKVTVIEYHNVKNITIKFDNGYIDKSSYTSLQKGEVRSPYSKTIYNVGYLGEGKYTPKDDSKKITKEYAYWHGVMTRSYSEKNLIKQPTYKDVTCCSEWHNYQNFAKWYTDNFYLVDGETMQLDKDILHKGNKVYSPENCVFVPARINVLFVKNDKVRGEYPIGVSLDKKLKKYISTCGCVINNKNTRITLGKFNSILEAFQKYKSFKEDYIKKVADDYKSKIPKELYDAMYNWVVEIDD